MRILFVTLSLVVGVCAEEQRSVYEKWPSPTPWIHNKYEDFLDYMPNNAIVVEVGVETGGFSAFILRKTNPQKLYLVDCWCYQDPSVYDDPDNLVDGHQERIYQDVKAKFSGDSRVEILREFSADAVNYFADESLDWVYIDANHGYEAVKEDLRLWWPKVKKGGMFSGHDYAVRPSFGVVQAVNEFLLEHDMYFTYLTVEDHIYDSWAIRKPL